MLTEEQRKNRLNGIGASDSAIIMGFSTYKTPYELYLEKTGLVSIDEDKETEQQYWGNKLEAVVLQHFAEHNDVKVTTPDTVYHKDYPFIFANLDGFCPELNAVIEIKCSSSFMKSTWDEAQEDGIPMQYLIQIAKQVAIVDAQVGFCAVLIGGNEYRQYTYERDKDLENMILDADIKFWGCVANKIEPEPITISDLVIKYPKSTHASIPCDSNIIWDIESVRQERDKIKIHEQNLEKYKMKIMSYMKHADCIVDADNIPIATWKQNKRGSRTFLIK